MEQERTKNGLEPLKKEHYNNLINRSTELNQSLNIGPLPHQIESRPLREAPELEPTVNCLNEQRANKQRFGQSTDQIK